MSLRGFRGPLLSVSADPHIHGASAVRHEPDGLLVVDDGIVAARGDYRTIAGRFPDLAITHFPHKLIVPGFIDAHVHYPQVDSIAAHGERLLNWLETHIFPVEAAFAQRSVADEAAAFFCEELLRNGTTSALVFATVHPQSVDALFDAALARNMRLISGKVLMDRGPEGLADTVQSGREDSEALIARWRGRGRLGYAVTPRFALTSSSRQLAMAGDLLAAHPDVLLHTHLSENTTEISEARSLFPDACEYTDIYARHGLVNARAVFAHGTHLSAREHTCLAQADASIAFCPTSNLFLGSGLFDVAGARAAGLRVALGSDVGAGTSFSILHTQGMAYQIAQMRGEVLDPMRALYFATAAGAAALGIADKVGALDEGQEADFLVLDPKATPLLARRTAGANLSDTLFALQILGDDRAVAFTYLMGTCAYRRDATQGSIA